MVFDNPTHQKPCASKLAMALFRKGLLAVIRKLTFWFALTGYFLTFLYYYGPWGIAYSLFLFHIFHFGCASSESVECLSQRSRYSSRRLTLLATKLSGQLLVGSVAGF